MIHALTKESGDQWVPRTLGSTQMHKRHTNLENGIPGERHNKQELHNRKVGAEWGWRWTPIPPPPLEAPVRKIILQMHTPARSSQCWSWQTQHGLGVCIWMHLVNGTGNSPPVGEPTLE